MAQPIPFSRNTGAARARHDKAMLLPIARKIADDLALRVHLALDALHRGAGSMSDAQTLTQTMLLTGFLAESGFGSMSDEQLGAAERVVSAVFDMGRETSEWRLDSAGFALFADIATNYDRQLHSAPLWAITDASERLDRFAAGMPYQSPVRKRA
jgi:predicted exporter